MLKLDPPLVASTHLIGHAMREIESGLRDVLEPFKRKLGVEEDTPVAIEWINHDRLKNERHARSASGEESHREEILAILRGLNIEKCDPVEAAWLSFVGRKGDRTLHTLAHRDGLDSPRPLDSTFLDEWSKMEHILDHITLKLEENTLGYISRLDVLLSHEKPIPSTKKKIGDIQFLKKHLPNNLVVRRYFFNKLDSPHWLAPLQEAGFFKTPPRVIIREDKNGKKYSFIPWPESFYLARMAPLEPRVVCNIILNMDDSDNAAVYGDLADAALAVPAGMTKELLPKIRRWISSPFQFLLPEKLGLLISHLVSGDEVQAALELADAVLEILPGEPRTLTPPSNDAGDTEKMSYRMSALPPDARCRFDNRHYDRILVEHIPRLLDKAGLETLQLLCRKLDGALLHERGSTQEGKESDGSFYWRRAIENHEANQYQHGVKDSLVTAIRDSAEKLARDHCLSPNDLCDSLRTYEWPVFDRLALHTMRLFPDHLLGKIEETVMNHDNWDNPHIRHEFVLLVRACFSRLSATACLHILAWIGKNLSEEEARRILLNRGVAEPSEDQVLRVIETEQLERMSYLDDLLPKELRAEYDRLIEKYGRPSTTEFPFVTSSWVGPTSPLSVEQIAAKTIAELVTYLKSWEKPSGDWTPTPEGFSRVLRGCVATNPIPYAQGALLFRDINEPTCFTGLFGGLEEAVKAGKLFLWEPVIELCHWAIAQPRSVLGRREKDIGMDRNPHWGWAWGHIADLIGTACNEEFANLPFSLRHQLWSILEFLANDPDPTSLDERGHGGSNMSPATYSINTTRGKAMHAVIHFACWLAAHYKESADNESIPRIPEAEWIPIQKVLDEHLDPSYDPSVAIRSVYGQYFPWLQWINPRWTSENVPRIFPSAPNLVHLWKAAWEAHIVFCKPYRATFSLLRDVYRIAIERSLADSPGNDYPCDPHYRLTGHLMNLYLAREIDFDTPDGLLLLFYDRASDPLRASAIQWIGRHFQDTLFSQEDIERLKFLWERRLSTMEVDPENHTTELAAFGHWFANYAALRSLESDDDRAVIEDEWALKHLLNVLRLNRNIDDAWDVAQQLARLSDRYPLLAIEILGLMVPAPKDEFNLMPWKEETRQIVQAVNRSGNAEAKNTARRLVNRLAALGFVEYRDLLES